MLTPREFRSETVLCRRKSVRKHIDNMLICHKNNQNWCAQQTWNHFHTYDEAFFDENRALCSVFDSMPMIVLRLPNYPQATEGNRDWYSLKHADFKSGFTFFLKWRGAMLDINEVCVLPSNQCNFRTFSLLNVRN